MKYDCFSPYWECHRGGPSGWKEFAGRMASVRKDPEGEDSDLLNVDGSLFRKVFSINRRHLRHGEFTAAPYENDYSNADCFLTSDGLAGFAISEGWLISLFSNRGDGRFLESVAPLIASRASKLVVLIGSESGRRMVERYSELLGFHLCAETIDDTEAMVEFHGPLFVSQFIRFNGRPKHVFMTKVQTAGVEFFDDYFDAYEYVDRL